jgi:hypothetical protein
MAEILALLLQLTNWGRVSYIRGWSYRWAYILGFLVGCLGLRGTSGWLGLGHWILGEWGVASPVFGSGLGASYSIIIYMESV